MGEVLNELIEYAESYRPEHPALSNCRAIVSRLRAQAGPFRESRQATVPVVATHNRPQAPGRPIEIFFSYAHEDEDLMNAVRLQLVVRERLGQIVKWHDRMIPAGDEWRQQIDQRIEQANVILLFMSPDFLASRYCYEVEGQIALRRHRDGSARAIPVVLRPCDWSVTPFGDLQALPEDGLPFTQAKDRDQASLEIARGIMDSINP